MDKKKVGVPLVCHGHSRPVVDLFYSPVTPDGYFLISASKDSTPMLRNGETGDWIGTFEGHKGAVWSCCLDTNALRAASASADFSAKLWDALTGDVLHSFDHKHIVRTCSFSEDTHFLLTGGFEKKLRIFDLNRPDASPREIEHSPGSIRTVLWLHSDQTILSSCSDSGGVRLWDVRSGEMIHTLETKSSVTSAEVSKDGRYITTADGSSVKFWKKNGVLNEKQLPAGNKTGPTPVQVVHTQPDPPNTAQIENTHTVMNHKPDSHQVPSRSESVESEEHVEREEIVESEENVEQEETVESEEDAAESEEMIVQSESDVYNDQSSDGYVEREKWLDLSPRFFVKGESERLEYEEDDVDFFMVNDEDHRQLKYQYPEYDQIDKIAGQSRVSIFDRLSFKKRSIHKRLIFNVQRGSDLRGYLEKSKLVDFNRRIRKKFRPHGPRSEVVFDHRGSLRQAVPVNRYRPPLKKPRFVSSDVSRVRRPAQQHKREYREQSAAFTGPKTLEQIKEEKIKARENRDFGSNNRTGSDGCFQAPRPLSEILKNKRKLG